VLLGAGLFDTKGAAAGLIPLVREKLAPHFPHRVDESVVHVELPALRDVNVDIRLEQDSARVALAIELVDTTRISVAIRLRLVTRGGAPAFERVALEDPTWEGPTWDEAVRQARAAGGEVGMAGGAVMGAAGGPIGVAIGAVIGLFAGSEIGDAAARATAPDKLRGVVSEKLDKALGELALGLSNLRRPWAPFRDHPKDTLAFSVGDGVRVSPMGIALPLCVKATVGGQPVDATIRGPVAAPRRNARSSPVAEGGPTIRIVADDALLNQVLYFLWQSGTLRQLGTSAPVVDALPKALRMLAFDVTGFEPGLPPTIPAVAPIGTSDLPLALGDVQIGRWGARRVVAHALLGLSVAQVEDTLRLRAGVHRVTVGCTERKAGGVELTPCLADLLPAARDELARRSDALSFDIAGGDLLGRMPALMYEGVALRLSRLRASTTQTPPGLEVRVDARLAATR
jgi:hypothetical protein